MLQLPGMWWLVSPSTRAGQPLGHLTETGQVLSVVLGREGQEFFLQCLTLSSALIFLVWATCAWWCSPHLPSHEHRLFVQGSWCQNALLPFSCRKGVAPATSTCKAQLSFMKECFRLLKGSLTKVSAKTGLMLK